MKLNAAITMMDGQAGVHSVIAQLLLRGIRPSIPSVDVGYDLILEGGIRLQVKSAHLTYPKAGKYDRPNFGARGGTVRGNYLNGAYGFSVRRNVWDQKNGRMIKAKRGSYEGVADFFVLWGIEDNRFWIVPTSIENQVIWFGRKDTPNGSGNRKYTNALKLDRCAQYENRWDLLDVNSTVEVLIESEPPAAAVTEQR